ncbi:MAG TPA: helix-turn-helix domain-containing protein [Gemmatimonadaceae bacterium]|jgi:AcrR family transcriptional regulator|nr:helix-turn-helix domain-containing protein [Gemmatimonadaceae bacterium]
MCSARVPAPPRQRILDAADELFRRVGIRGVGVEAIAEAAGTNKMTLYRHFASKDELVAEWVRGIVAQKEAEWDEIAAKHPGDPAAQLVDWSRRVAKRFAEMEERGSTLGNALAELPEPDHPARQVIDAHRVREHERIRRVCREAAFPEPELAADQFYMLLEGAKACVHCIGLTRVGEHLMRSVDALIAARRNQATRASGSRAPSRR